jgi:alkanesulfonate monooxygenase SsuD/methylene tetrahydromethanopterin reductase-like flavin-dependent oxidoreductase (luciferase family)
MKIGIALPQAAIKIDPTSPTAEVTPVTITQIAQEAERQDFSSLWTLERLFYPRQFVAYGNNTYGIPVPEEQRSTFDALETLVYAAAKTERIKLGTSVVNILYQSPIIIARRYTTLDHLSGGRVIAGFGQGWHQHEFEATNTSTDHLSRDFGRFVSELRAIWGPNPVKFEDPRFPIVESDIDPKPIQAGGPPVLFGTSSPQAVKLAGKLADGLNPVLFNWEMAETIARDFPEQVRLNGRDPSNMEIIARANNGISAQPLPESRMPLMGSIEQISEDMQRLEEMGIRHVFFDLAGISIAERLQQMEKLRRAASNVK